MVGGKLQIDFRSPIDNNKFNELGEIKWDDLKDLKQT